MALFRRKMRRETATKQKYIRYFNRMKSAGKLRQALTYSQWLKSRKGTTVRTKAVTRQLRRSLSEAEIRRLRDKR